MIAKTWVDVFSNEIEEWKDTSWAAHDRSVRALTTIWDIINKAEQVGLLTTDEHHNLVEQIRHVIPDSE